MKLSHVKPTKFSKICDDIEYLIWNSEPSLSQDSLSLNIYGKTGSSEIMTDLHRLGHELSYTETKFIEDKWVEWSKEKSKLVPNHFRDGVLATHVVDNIDWKSKTFKGIETHNTNSIIIQQEYVTEHTNQSNVASIPDIASQKTSSIL